MFRTKWTKMEEKAPAYFEEMFLRSWDNEIMFGYLLGSAFKSFFTPRVAHSVVGTATFDDTEHFAQGGLKTDGII